MAISQTAAEKHLQNSLEKHLNALIDAGYAKKSNKGDKIQFMKIKVDANGIRSWETDPSVLGPKVAEVAQMALDYLNRRAKGITATKHASGFISLLNISKYDLERKIDKNVPQLAGKYFEWCVYVEFTKMLKKYDPDVKADGTKESFYNQRNYLMPYRAKYPTLMPQIQQIAKMSVRQFFDYNGTQNLKDWVCEILAGSDKTSDLKLYNSKTKRTIYLELKLYSSPSRIHYATLDDMKNFDFSYMMIMRKHKSSETPQRGMSYDEGAWYSRVAAKDPIIGSGASTFNAWINLIHGERGAQYMIDSIQKRGRINGINVKTEAGMLNYFMQKGDPILQQWGAKKQAIVGIRTDFGGANDGRVEALFDIDFLEPSRNIVITYDRNGAVFRYSNGSEASNAILSVNATTESLKNWVETQEAITKGKANEEDVHWSSLPQVKLELQMYQAYWQSKGKI